LVLGGGDTAMDCARTAVRQQASSVYCAYRRNEASMPGSKREVYKAKEEGVKFLWHYQPLEIIGSDQVEAVRFARTKIVVDALTQRNVLEIDERDEAVIPADAVVIAFGFQPHEINWLNRYNIQTDAYGRIQTNVAINDHGGNKAKNVSEANAVNGTTEAIEAKKQKRFAFQTHNDKVFAGGDITRGSDLVVTAIFEGRSAARGIISYLSE
ncbi:MAG: FAD-dependent oxidoreductase, partial [Proteobacteria bacterium]|nr:FAD-dependent oxidoreductase [Pseudomonadota bacterium]